MHQKPRVSTPTELSTIDSTVAVSCLRAQHGHWFELIFLSPRNSKQCKDSAHIHGFEWHPIGIPRPSPTWKFRVVSLLTKYVLCQRRPYNSTDLIICQFSRFTSWPQSISQPTKRIAWLCLTWLLTKWDPKYWIHMNYSLATQWSGLPSTATSKSS